MKDPEELLQNILHKIPSVSPALPHTGEQDPTCEGWRSSRTQILVSQTATTPKNSWSISINALPSLWAQQILVYLSDQHVVVHFDVNVDRSFWKCLKHFFQEWDPIVCPLTLTFWRNKKLVTAAGTFNKPQIKANVRVLITLKLSTFNKVPMFF